MKKEYMKPTMRVVKIQHKCHLLAGSRYDSVEAPVRTYDEPEDVITDKGYIW